MKLRLIAILVFIFFVQHSAAKDDGSSGKDTPMNNQRLDQLIKRFDHQAKGDAGFWVIQYKGYQANIITDENADRMRIIVQIAISDELEKQQLYRLMQANFDSALDARYSIAKGVVWSAYIHPLSSLSNKEFISGLAQTITLAATYGTSFSSGALIFRGGDSQQEREKLYREIIEKVNSI